MTASTAHELAYIAMSLAGAALAWWGWTRSRPLGLLLLLFGATICLIVAHVWGIRVDRTL
jgi:uncharacterized integral membrane protein